jgi:hypothetical protein
MSRDDLSSKQQLSRSWLRLDDPWGITWRVVNAFRRFSINGTLRLARGIAANQRLERPIFVIGAPRSGTTMLFHLLRESSMLGSLNGEGHNAWRMYHHPRYSGWRSDAIGHGRVCLGERRFINGYFSANATAGRLVEKTPENSLRIPYLLDLFPDASFVLVKRDPCEVINSLINCWRNEEGRFRSYYVPEKLNIRGYSERKRWCFALIDGWRNFAQSGVPEIALEQWAQCVKGVAAGRELVAPERWMEVHLEHLLANPQGTLQMLLGRLGLEDELALQTKLSELVANPVNAQSRQEEQKWKGKNYNEIVPLLPAIDELSVLSDYRINPETGNAEILDHRK